MNTSLLAFILLLLSPFGPIANAADFARVEQAQGPVKFEGKPVAAGDALPGPGTMSAEAGGSARVRLASGAEVKLTSGTAFKIDRDGGQLVQGTARWKVPPIQGKRRFLIRTGSAVMGVRGTDFMGVYNALLGESEIVVFDGKVEFQSAADPKDSKLVNQGQWGGVGGRFRAKIGDLIDLPKNVLDAFQAATD